MKFTPIEILKSKNNNLTSQNIDENVIFSKKDGYYNCEKFDNGKENILLVTGFSGSGKSTLSQELAKMYNASIVELDYLDFYLISPRFTIDVIRNKYYDAPLYSFITHNHIEKPKSFSEEDRKEYQNRYFKFLIDYCHANSNKKYIINGFQIYHYIDKSLYKGLPTIVVGTSALRSASRGAKRNTQGTKKNWSKEFALLFNWGKKDDKLVKEFEHNIADEK